MSKTEQIPQNDWIYRKQTRQNQQAMRHEVRYAFFDCVTFKRTFCYSDVWSVIINILFWHRRHRRST